MKTDLVQLFQSDSEEPFEHITQMRGFQIKKEKKSKTITYAKKWSVQENQAYISYLAANSAEFEKERIRRQLKIFKKMSVQMQGTRSAEQCRGHHKKMLQKYGQIQNIIKGATQRNQYLKRQKMLRQSKKKNRKNAPGNFDENFQLLQSQNRNTNQQNMIQNKESLEVIFEDEDNSFDEEKWKGYFSL